MSFFPPSLDQQLRSAREASGQKFLWAHIDTCLSCFLHDHHHRDGELLLGVYVDGSSTVGDVLDGLKDEFRQIAWDLGESRLGYDHLEARKALDVLIDENADRREQLFDSSLEVLDEDFDGETCQAWFLLTWDLPDDEESE